MKNTVLLVCLFLIAGCAAPPQDSSSEEGKNSPPASQTRAAIEVSEDASCNTLLGNDGGLISQSAAFLRDVTGLDDEVAAEANDIAVALDGVSQTASPRLEELLTVMQEPFQDLIAANSSGEMFSFDPSRFKASGNEVIAICDVVLGDSGASADGPDAASFKVSTEATCQLLLGVNDDGPLIKSVTFIVDMVNGKKELTAADVETSRDLSRQLNEIMETADETIRPYIEESVKPLDMLAAKDSTGIKVDMSTYKAANVELLTLCP